MPLCSDGPNDPPKTSLPHNDQLLDQMALEGRRNQTGCTERGGARRHRQGVACRRRNVLQSRRDGQP